MIAAGNAAPDNRGVRTLDHVRWLGGGSGAGKTTVTRLLAARFDLRRYSTDDTIAAHSARLDAVSAPLLHRFLAMSMDERWVRRSPTTMWRTFPWFHGEGFGLLLDDLRDLPTDRIVLVEGFRLLPLLTQPQLSDPSHAVWLLPTPSFRRAAFERREPADAFWARTTDPGVALANLLERDRIFTAVIADDAASKGLTTLPVDGARTVDDVTEELAHSLGLTR